MSFLINAIEHNYSSKNLVVSLTALELPVDSPEKTIRVSLSVADNEVEDSWSVSSVIAATAIKLGIPESVIVLSQDDGGAHEHTGG